MSTIAIGYFKGMLQIRNVTGYVSNTATSIRKDHLSRKSVLYPEGVDKGYDEDNVRIEVIGSSQMIRLFVLFGQPGGSLC